jgi:REP element-mobilizing transposase RayT
MIMGQRIIMDESNNIQPSTLLIEPKGWHSRGYLPHFDAGATPQSVTFRLFDSFPALQLAGWVDQLELMSSEMAKIERCRRIEAYLDKGKGVTWLSEPAIAEIVEGALLCFDGQRYHLHARVIMPNHVHVLLTPDIQHGVSQILKSWKSFTAKKANSLLQRRGAFWQEDYFDRLIRDQKHFETTITYIENNPVMAGLCQSPTDWPYSSAGKCIRPF